MKNLVKASLALATLSILVSACSNPDPAMTFAAPPPEKKIEYGLVERTATGLVQTFDTRVDVLLIIDDSSSMKAHTTNFSKNINAFVDGFATSKLIDFHIGYTFVHDNQRYGPVVPQTCGAGTSSPNYVNWETPGTLKQIVGFTSPDGRRYLTREDDFRTILKANLDPALNPLMIKDFKNPDEKDPTVCARGAEYEDSFTPLVGAVKNQEVLNGANKGFRRPGALFVAIIISDAKDESGMKPQDVVESVEGATRDPESTKRKFRLYTVAVTPGTKIGCTRNSKGVCVPTQGVCKPDPAFATREISPGSYEWPTSRVVTEEENPLVIASRMTEDSDSKIDPALSICSDDYGKQLAVYGYQVQTDTLNDMELNMASRPQEFAKDSPDYATKRLQVFIGTVPLPEKNWDYDLSGPTIRIHDVDWTKYPNEKIRVSYTPVDETKNTVKVIN